MMTKRPKEHLITKPKKPKQPPRHMKKREPVKDRPGYKNKEVPGLVRFATKQVEEGILNYLDDTRNHYFENVKVTGKISFMGNLGYRKDTGMEFLPFTIYTHYIFKGMKRRKWWKCWAYRVTARLIAEHYEIGDWIKVTKSVASIYYPTEEAVKKYNSKPKLQLYVSAVLPKWETELAPEVSLELMKAGKINPQNAEPTGADPEDIDVNVRD